MTGPTATDLRRDAYLVADRDGVIVSGNEAACELFGLSSAEMVGLHLAPNSPTEILQALGRRWAEFVDAGSLSGSTTVTRPDGSASEVTWSAQAGLPIPSWHLIRIRAATEPSA